MESLVDRSSKVSDKQKKTGHSNDEVHRLVTRAIDGDFDAFDQIMLLYRERLYGVIYNMTFNHDG